MFKVVAIIMAIASPGAEPEPTGMEFPSRVKFATADECAAELSGTRIARGKAEMEAFLLQLPAPKSVKLTVTYECRKFDDGSI